MKKTLKKLYDYFMPQEEEENMIKFLKKMNLPEHSRILDVGCGYGRNMNLIKANCDKDILIEGVDINKHIVQIHREKGLSCYTVEEFQQSVEEYDCLIFSHIIEHFTPEGLKAFLETYLERLKDGGYVIIATPVSWRGFYWDFDHIKMYHPCGINMVFGNNKSQVQYYSDIELSLKDIWFRKTPYMIHYKRGLYVRDKFTSLWNKMELFYRFLFKISFGILGETTGWMAVYKKNGLKGILAKEKILDYPKQSIAIWGMGKTADKLLLTLRNLDGFQHDLIRGFFNGQKLDLVGKKYDGYEILDCRRLNEYNLKVIIIAAIGYEDEIRAQIEKFSKDEKINIVGLKGAQ